MWFSRFALVCVGISSLLAPIQDVSAFVPYRIEHASRGLSVMAQAMGDADRYLARVQEFGALVKETYAEQREELRSIHESLRILQDNYNVPPQTVTPPLSTQSSYNSNLPPPPPPPPPPSLFESPPPPPPPVAMETEYPIESQSADGWQAANGAANGWQPYDGNTGEFAVAPPPMNGYANGQDGAVVAPPPMNDTPVQTTTSATISIAGPDYSPTISLEDEEVPSTASLLAGSTFQLEEMEDREACATEITLEKDHTITVGLTDGPLFASATGTWIAMPDQVDMVITRHFDAGQKSRNITALGEFSFSVERTYLGQVTRVGDRLAATGTIHNLDDFVGDEEVGYFNMIDNREGDEDEEGLEGFPRIPVGRSMTS